MIRALITKHVSQIELDEKISESEVKQITPENILEDLSKIGLKDENTNNITSLEQLVSIEKDTKIYPNCSKGKSESLNVLEGKMKLINFDNNGNVTKKLNMEPLGSSANPFLYRFNKCEWHTMVAISDLVLVHEILEGPFNNMKNFKNVFFDTLQIEYDL